MATRIAGVNMPQDKRIAASLTYILGIGFTRAKKILEQAKLENKRVKDLKEAEINKIREIIEKNYIVEGDLRREVSSNIKRLKDIKSYRGFRHSKRLPVRGQRTKTNSRTVRGNRRSTLGSGKSNTSSQKT